MARIVQVDKFGTPKDGSRMPIFRRIDAFEKRSTGDSLNRLSSL